MDNRIKMKKQFNKLLKLKNPKPLEPATTQKPKERIECTLCPQRFVSDYNLHRHMKSEHLGQKFTCGSCLQTFTRAYNLKLHDPANCTGQLRNGRILSVTPVTSSTPNTFHTGPSTAPQGIWPNQHPPRKAHNIVAQPSYCSTQSVVRSSKYRPPLGFITPDSRRRPAEVMPRIFSKAAQGSNPEETTPHLSGGTVHLSFMDSLIQKDSHTQVRKPPPVSITTKINKVNSTIVSTSSKQPSTVLAMSPKPSCLNWDLSIFDNNSPPQPNLANSTISKSNKRKTIDQDLIDMTKQLDILLEDEQPPLKKTGIISLTSDLDLSDTGSDTESLPDLLCTKRPAEETKDTPVPPPENHTLLDSLRPAWYQEFNPGSFKELITLILQDATALGHLPENTHTELLPVLTKIHKEFLALLTPNLHASFEQMRPLSEYL